MSAADVLREQAANLREAASDAPPEMAEGFIAEAIQLEEEVTLLEATPEHPLNTIFNQLEDQHDV